MISLSKEKTETAPWLVHSKPCNNCSYTRVNDDKCKHDSCRYCCKSNVQSSRIKLTAWIFGVLNASSDDIQNSHGYFVICVVFPPSKMQSTGNIVSLSQYLITHGCAYSVMNLADNTFHVDILKDLHIWVSLL